jgi:hypothetical protein
MTYKKIPSLASIDRRDKLELWLAMEVLEQGVWDVEEIYDLLESYFALVSEFRELKIKVPLVDYVLPNANSTNGRPQKHEKENPQNG